MTENAMRDGIVICSYVPSGIDSTLAELASDYAKRLINAMDYVGVLAIEFVLTGGELSVNEIAPRVHNTGHWTIGAVGADQFTQHVVCITCGISLPGKRWRRLRVTGNGCKKICSGRGTNITRYNS